MRESVIHESGEYRTKEVSASGSSVVYEVSKNIPARIGALIEFVNTKLELFSHSFVIPVITGMRNFLISVALTSFPQVYNYTYTED